MSQLQTVKVGQWTITEPTTVNAVRNARLTGILQPRIKDFDDDTIVAAYLWPRVAALVTPELTLEDWLNMPDQTSEKMLNVCKELAPHWFIPPGQALTEEKKSTASQSLSGSATLPVKTRRPRHSKSA